MYQTRAAGHASFRSRSEAYLFVAVSARDGVSLSDNILNAIKYQPEATRICLSELNDVVQAEAKQAYDIRYSGD